MRAAIDFGISNTDVVARIDGRLRHWSQPSLHAPDASRLRALLAAGDIALEALTHIAVTGGRHRTLPERIGDCDLVRVNEVAAIGRGGQALIVDATYDSTAPALGRAAQHDHALIVVSAGSGTAVVSARGHTYAHVTGSGVGGGTLLGLGRLLLQTADPREIDALAQQGDANGADLSIGDVISGPIGTLPPDATAVNFGKLGRQDIAVSKPDLAAALITLVAQTIGTLAVNAARAQGTQRIVVVGHMTDLLTVRRVLTQVGDLYGMDIDMPPDSGCATALGALHFAAERSVSD